MSHPSRAQIQTKCLQIFEGLCKLSTKDEVKHVWVELKDIDTLSKHYLKESLTN